MVLSSGANSLRHYSPVLSHPRVSYQTIRGHPYGPAAVEICLTCLPGFAYCNRGFGRCFPIALSASCRVLVVSHVACMVWHSPFSWEVWVINSSFKTVVSVSVILPYLTKSNPGYILNQRCLSTKWQSCT